MIEHCMYSYYQLLKLQYVENEDIYVQNSHPIFLLQSTKYNKTHGYFTEHMNVNNKMKNSQKSVKFVS